MDKVIIYTDKDTANKWVDSFIEKHHQYIWIAEDDGKCIHIALTNYNTLDLIPFDKAMTELTDDEIKRCIII